MSRHADYGQQTTAAKHSYRKWAEGHACNGLRTMHAMYKSLTT